MIWFVTFSENILIADTILDPGIVRRYSGGQLDVFGRRGDICICSLLFTASPDGKQGMGRKCWNEFIVPPFLSPY
jgi:hypothetical protein